MCPCSPSEDQLESVVVSSWVWETMLTVEAPDCCCVHLGASDLLRSVVKYTKVSLLAGNGSAWYIVFAAKVQESLAVYVVRVDVASEC